MKPDTCPNGHGAAVRITTKVIGSARRRMYKCSECGETFRTVELRIPPLMDMAVFQAKVRSMLKKGIERGKAKGKDAGTAVQVGEGMERVGG